jgi:hypothetical protein
MSNVVLKRERLARLINSRVRKAGLAKHVNSEATACASGINMFVTGNGKAVLDSIGDKVPGGKFDEIIGVIWWEIAE